MRLTDKIYFDLIAFMNRPNMIIRINWIISSESREKEDTNCIRNWEIITPMGQ